MVQTAKYTDFSRRLEQACADNPHVPPHNFGRLRWFADELAKHGVEVRQETIRKWFAGETRPREKPLAALAKILRADSAWLLVGSTSGITEKEARVRNAAADGAVNLVAGLVQMHGARPAFPRQDDEFAQKHKIDLYAIIKGVQYPFHVTLFHEGKAIVPFEAEGSFVLGVIPLSPTSFKLVEVDREGLAAAGKRKSGFIEITEDSYPWREIESFQERL